jgi:DNA-binding MarR family transcriptional regulator
MGDAASTAVAVEVTQALTELFFSAENQQRFHGAADELGVSPPALKALLELEPGGGLSMRSLAELWGCDASFVTVMVDGLERLGLVERQVADHDRRIKTVELTPEGVAARERALETVYAPRAGFLALTASERTTLAKLLRKMTAAQATYDERLLDDPDVRAGMRRMAQQRTREFRARGEGRGSGGHSWRAHLEEHRQELERLKREIDRVRAEMKAQARGPIDGARAAAKDEVKAASDQIKREVKAAAREAKGQPRASSRRR